MLTLSTQKIPFQWRNDFPNVRCHFSQQGASGYLTTIVVNSTGWRVGAWQRLFTSCTVPKLNFFFEGSNAEIALEVMDFSGQNKFIFRDTIFVIDDHEQSSVITQIQTPPPPPSTKTFQDPSTFIYSTTPIPTTTRTTRTTTITPVRTTITTTIARQMTTTTSRFTFSNGCTIPADVEGCFIESPYPTPQPGSLVRHRTQLVYRNKVPNGHVLECDPDYPSRCQFKMKNDVAIPFVVRTCNALGQWQGSLPKCLRSPVVINFGGETAQDWIKNVLLEARKQSLSSLVLNITLQRFQQTIMDNKKYINTFYSHYLINQNGSFIGHKPGISSGLAICYDKEQKLVKELQELVFSTQSLMEDVKRDVETNILPTKAFQISYFSKKINC